MEFTDYLAAIRVHWRAWIGVALAALAIAAGVIEVTPKTYQAQAQVFVAVSPAIPNSAQFVAQRVKSYPDVAVSAAVLGPVMDRLNLTESLSDLRKQISSDVPQDTSQVDITVTDGNAARAARIANAVASRLTTVVENLETPADGHHPVTLTVSNPAVVPNTPVSPKPAYILGLAALVGLFLGLALAVVRSRTDTRLYDVDDIRRAWGTDSGLEVLAPARGRARRRLLTARPARMLARRLQLVADDRPVRVVLVSPSPADRVGPRRLAEETATELARQGLPVRVYGPDEAVPAPDDVDAGGVFRLADPLAPPQYWREEAGAYDGVVVVVPSGRVDSSELGELRMLLRAAEAETLAVVLTSRRGRRKSARAARGPVAERPETSSPTVEEHSTEATAHGTAPTSPVVASQH